MCVRISPKRGSGEGEHAPIGQLGPLAIVAPLGHRKIAYVDRESPAFVVAVELGLLVAPPEAIVAACSFGAPAAGPRPRSDSVRVPMFSRKKKEATPAAEVAAAGSGTIVPFLAEKEAKAQGFRRAFALIKHAPTASSSLPSELSLERGQPVWLDPKDRSAPAGYLNVTTAARKPARRRRSSARPPAQPRSLPNLHLIFAHARARRPRGSTRPSCSAPQKKRMGSLDRGQAAYL